MKVFAEGPWSRSPKIILGIDIGTTQSAVAFAYLYPGGPQSLHRVTAWPGQEAQKGESKIPTLVYYDSDNKPVSFGAEALKPEIVEKAEDEHWKLARHFKLHLHPEAMKNKHNLRAQPLPAGVSLMSIYTDFMVYLLKHTKDFFESRIIDGQKVWEDHHKDMTIVLAHPNGWGVKEQNFLRQAAIAANYVSSSKAISQIRFVSEAEASVHFCMFHGDLHNRLKPDTTFIVCDAGGSTVDTTAYCVKTASPMLELEEKKASACVQAGGVFVDGEFEQHLTRILNRIDSIDDEERSEYIQKAVKDFESVAKKEFEDAGRPYRVDLGSGKKFKHEEFGISRGVISLEGGTVETFFDKCVTQTIESVRQQMSGLDPKHILLVGGFGDSLYLRKSLMDTFGSDGCTVNIANDSTAKAVADGAVIWCGKLSVVSRATRMPFGVEINDPYSAREPSHAGRPVHRHDAGYDYVTGKWSQIVGRGVVMHADGAMRESYWRSYKNPSPRLANFKVTMFAYTADGTPNAWLRDPQGNMNRGFEQICEVEADLSGMRQALKRKTGRDGEYYYLDFTMALQFGGTELQAFVEWEQDGETRTGPASILPSALASAQV
ncbi:Heat shock 70 kDa protein 12A [Rhizoctonia solani AG-1 IB]|uniref:Heat shock 70 kDa protein 12A n=1 Tax=Thanatephorus cucumeris (strain AG1-IB / isolate 7/3/14) TaxID=1108050 RepID=M5C5Q6_THACB|nr:Heat shock 70 kDa protein 12A [Rhizoctonia solani AG-1 IB]